VHGSTDEHIELLELLLETQCAAVNTAATDGYAAVHVAAQNNSIESLRMLLEKGALVGLPARSKNLPRSGASPVYEAAVHNSREALELLCEYEADVNQALYNGSTPLFAARYHRSENAAVYLEGCGAVLRPPMFMLRCVAAVPVAAVAVPLLFVFGGLFLNRHNNRAVLNNSVGRVIGRGVLDGRDGRVCVY